MQEQKAMVYYSLCIYVFHLVSNMNIDSLLLCVMV